jgi:hypothetical protein
MTLRALCTCVLAAAALAVAAPTANAQAPPPPPADCTPGPPPECPHWRNTDVQVTWYPSPSVTRDFPTGCSTAKPVVTAEGITRLECAVGNATPGWIWGTANRGTRRDQPSP